MLISFLAPDGPPTNISMEALNSTSISINMSIPVKDLINGIILGYEVSIWNYLDFHSRNYSRFDDEFQSEVEFGNLRKFFNHTVTIKAYTKFGLGVSSEEMVIETLEDSTYQLTVYFC